MDEENYYPDEYLNRLAHEGINGLWLSVEFKDLCPSRFFPGQGADSSRRLAKLRQTVGRCARYGIRIYLYCNEPVSFGDMHFTRPLSELEGNPWFAGHREQDANWVYFCTSSEEGREYVESCARHIFTEVPGLGGMICITHGEIPTNCYSYPHNFFGSNCPRCSKREPWEVYQELLAAFAAGIKKAAPDAEFISWFYTPALVTDRHGAGWRKEEVLSQIAAHAPKGVTMQFNFESNGKVRQLGREFTAYDYWLAYPGPSGFFSECASNAIKRAGAGVSAKIQVGCSHEDATIPFIPVPGSLYRKYRAMKELGVGAVMQCWYFGNYPGLMNKAAGELSFLPFAGDGDGVPGAPRQNRLAGEPQESRGRLEAFHGRLFLFPGRPFLHLVRAAALFDSLAAASVPGRPAHRPQLGVRLPRQRRPDRRVRLLQPFARRHPQAPEVHGRQLAQRGGGVGGAGAPIPGRPGQENGHRPEQGRRPADPEREETSSTSMT